MRASCAFVLLSAPLAGAAGSALAAAGEPAVRHGISPDLKAYPQGSAKETLASVLKAIDAGRIDYLLAQLADPAWVDVRVARLYGGSFAEQVEDTRARLDPATVKLLRRFLKEGEWTADKDQESVRLKDVSDMGVFFCRKGARWYLEHRSKPHE
jgi:hypothetical protein